MLTVMGKMRGGGFRTDFIGEFTGCCGLIAGF